MLLGTYFLNPFRLFGIRWFLPIFFQWLFFALFLDKGHMQNWSFLQQLLTKIMRCHGVVRGSMPLFSQVRHTDVSVSVCRLSCLSVCLSVGLFGVGVCDILPVWLRGWLSVGPSFCSYASPSVSPNICFCPYISFSQLKRRLWWTNVLPLAWPFLVKWSVL